MSNDPLDKIEKLASLKEKGVLTEEEFNSKKQILLETLTSCERLKNQEDEDGTYWLPIPSMILGIFTMFGCVDESNWDKDALNGVSLFIILSLVLGIISITIQNKGKGMAIAGITLSVLSALIVIGSTQ